MNASPISPANQPNVQHPETKERSSTTWTDREGTSRSISEPTQQKETISAKIAFWNSLSKKERKLLLQNQSKGSVSEKIAFWNSLSKKERKKVLQDQANEMRRNAAFNKSFPAAEKIIDAQFPVEVSEKIKGRVSSIFSGGEATPEKESLKLGDHKYRIEYVAGTQGEGQLRCTGAALAKGGNSLVRTAIVIEIVKEGQVLATPAVAYSALKEEKDLLSEKERIFKKIREKFPDDTQFTHISELIERFIALEKTSPDFQTSAIIAEKKQVQEEIEAELDLNDPKEERLKSLFVSVSTLASLIASATMERRVSIKKGFETWKALKKLKIPHLMEYLSVRTKGSSVIGAMAVRYESDLKSIFEKRPESTEERLQRTHMMLAVAETLKSLHKKNFCITDCKPANFLVDNEMHVYLSDLAGISKKGERTEELTERYRAPETKAGSPALPQADSYAFALMLSEALYGAEAVYGALRREQLKRSPSFSVTPKTSIRSELEKPEYSTDPVKKIILAGLEEAPEGKTPKRPSAEQYEKVLKAEISRLEKKLTAEALLHKSG